MSHANPSQIGKYTISATLGAGAMGVVYQGYDQQIDRVVAIKTIRKAAFSTEELADALERFQREAQAAGRLLHNNIVTVYEYGEEEDTAFIAMEFAQGHSLKELLNANKSFSVRAVRNIGRQLLTGLQYAHDHGVIHRDIKPENILLTKEGRIKIMDFGIARVESSNLTSVGTFMGTPAYMAPELFADQEADARSDLFAFGVVLYQIITGSRPFVGSTMSAIMHQVIQAEPVHPSTLVNGLPPCVDNLLQQALAKDPKDRFSSAKEFNQALQKALAPLDDNFILGNNNLSNTTASDATIYQNPSPKIQGRCQQQWRQLKNWQRGLILLVASSIMAALTWLLWPREQSPQPTPSAQITQISSSPSKIRVAPQPPASPSPPQDKIKIIAPATAKKRVRHPVSPAKNQGIAITSAPYQANKPLPSHGIRITVPQ